MAKQPTEADVEALADAMCRVMNEIAYGNVVSDPVKARARIAFEPFLLDDNGDLPSLEWAMSYSQKPKAIEPPPPSERGFLGQIAHEVADLPPIISDEAETR
jgi:hypothetical protein